MVLSFFVLKVNSFFFFIQVNYFNYFLKVTQLIKILKFGFETYMGL